MNTKHQLLIDRFVARPIAYGLNFLVRLVGKLLNIDHSLDHQFNKIVVCKFKGLGSIIQATPMLQALRENYPNAEITFLSTKSNASFLSKIEVIDKVITIDDSSAFRLISSLTSTVYKLIRYRPEVYIDLEIYSNFSTLVTIATLSKNRIGFYLRSSSFRMGIYTHMMYYNTNVPISEVYMQIARLMNPNSKSFGLYPLGESVEKATKFSFSNYIVINPNASDLRIERRWSSENYNALSLWICEQFPNKKVVFIGSKSEQAYVDEILNNSEHDNLINLAGKTTVDELISLIDHAELMITNDTGPMHIAFACNTPTIALFGPCSPEQYGWNSNARIIYERVYCSPCVHEFVSPPCRGNNRCMQLIQLTTVKNEITSFYMNKMIFPSLEQNHRKISYRFESETLGMVNRVN